MREKDINLLILHRISVLWINYLYKWLPDVYNFITKYFGEKF